MQLELPEQHAYVPPTSYQPLSDVQFVQLEHPQLVAVPAHTGDVSHVPDAHWFTAHAGPGQLVPFATLPVSTHAGVPPEQSRTPTRQGFAGVQALPPTHGTHAPPASHTPPAHTVPGAAAPRSTHAGAPPEQSVAPARQTPPGSQLAPDVHGVQIPAPSHTPPAQAAPAARFPETVQTGEPLPQSSVPVWHGFGGSQLAPGAHATQLPEPSQTPPAQGTPAAALPVARQAGAPPEQSTVPVRHSMPESQPAPGAHATHVPPGPQTPPGHVVPSAALGLAGQSSEAPSQTASSEHGPIEGRHVTPAASAPTGVQVGPPAQRISPRSHARAVAQGAPSAHGTHAPEASHTPPAHAVPTAAKPDSVQTGEPPEQRIAPVRHSMPGSHVAPDVQLTQVPAPSHTPPGQAEPSARGALAGHPKLVPSQLASAKHGPLAARQSSPAGAGVVRSQTPSGQRVDPRSQGCMPTHGASGTQLGAQVPPPSQRPRPGHGVSSGAGASAGHVPPLHRSGASQASRAARHTAPSGAGPEVAQTGAPPMQTVTPCWHASVTHRSPSTQVEQEPTPSQARPVPQRTPGGRARPSMHRVRPPSQLTTPVTQGLPVLQTVPARHSLHSPAAQTPLAPHSVLRGTSSWDTQTGIPDPQSVRPVTQGLPVLQTAPGAQTLQLPPPPHASPLPQRTPLGSVASSSHTVVVGSGQVARPVVQGFPVLQTESATHSLQTPSPQIPERPHGVPVRLRSRTQTGAPEPQSTRPLAHGSPVLQTAPSRQTEHVPSAAHAWPSPQAAPSGSRPVTRQCRTLPSHSDTPDAQGSSGGEHGVPGTQALPSGLASSTDRQATPSNMPEGHSPVWQPTARAASEIVRVRVRNCTAFH